jgi:predicted anti-sigma-YlaC factor YlaD
MALLRRAILAPAGFDLNEDAVLKCRDMAELVTRYLEGALPPRTRFAAWLHLRLCEACRTYVDQVRRTIRFLAGGPPPPPPEKENEIIALLETARRDG